MVEKRNIMSFINDNVNSNVINGSNNIVLKKDHFINKELVKSLNLELKGFEFFLDLTNLKNTEKEQVREILAEMKRLPAALGGHHGDYEGGLFDHTLLVVNYTYYLCATTIDQVDTKKAILTAIYHDFGKVPYYAYKTELKDCKIETLKSEKDAAHYEIILANNYKGNDYHVCGALAVIKKYALPYDDEIVRGIVFHHGSWSRYHPYDPNKISSIVHIADMMASQIFFV